MAAEKNDYLEFKLGLIERTISLYIQRMDIWEDQFYKIKYGCMAVILTLLGFRYTTSPNAPFLSYMALTATIVFWLFESTLRTTFFRYMAKLDLLTEIINNKVVMENALKSRDLSAARIFDFDIRTKTLKETVNSFVNAAHFDKKDEERKEIAKKIFEQKSKITTVWSSFKLKNMVAFYGALIVLQLVALIFFA
ncbi:MAG: hypothetical protein HZB50_12475 [Chloroflexi bacterium]|nr:hypothetical protein [Chloroflexota bacterium]